MIRIFKSEMRRGIGAWHFAPSRQELNWLQIIFSRYISILAPKVLEDLAGTPFNSFIAARLDSISDEKLNSIWGDLRDYHQIKNDPILSKWLSLSPPLQAFRKALRDWSDKSHLASDWWRKLAFDTLRMWAKNPSLKESLTWYPITVGYSRFGPDPEPPQGLLQWHTAIQNEEYYLKDVEREASQLIGEGHLCEEFYVKFNRRIAEQYIAGVNAHIKENENSARRVIKAPSLEDHLRWSVKALMLGLTYEEITNEEGIDALEPLNPDAVGRAVRRTLKVLGLSRKEGHPKDRKNSNRRVAR